jgi:glutamate N-acetyltransferase/amino-acid N-acetyltransferase
MNQTITSVKGIFSEGVRAGIKQKGRDVAVIYSESLADVSAVYTKNKVVAEPLKLTQQNLSNGKAQAIVINSGNANACTGNEGMQAAGSMAATVAKALNIKESDIIVASTGVIGEPFPVHQVNKGIQACTKVLSNTEQAGKHAAEAILTTDTMIKECYRELTISGKPVKIAGMAKGSGMIHPDMATMLAFIVSDIAIDKKTLDTMFKKAVDISFNMISIDGDTSTNDMAVCMCNGKAQNKPVMEDDKDAAVFQNVLEEVCIDLAKKIVQDGEGVSKFIEYEIVNAPNEADARTIIRTVSDSSLVKTAIFGKDPNWGRIIAAAGRAHVPFNVCNTDLYINGYLLMEKGQAVNQYKKEVKKALEEDEIFIKLDLNDGNNHAKGWGSDLTVDYVKFNAEYTT